MDSITANNSLAAGEAKKLGEQYQVGDATINDIVEELKKPSRDPREGFPKPVLQKEAVSFEDLSEGMLVKGKIKNVVDFGAFVDLGIKETALAHISELSDHFVKDPMEVVKVGDVLEFRIIGLDQDRRRISLSRKSGAGQERPRQQERKALVAAGTARDEAKKPGAARKPGTSGGADRGSREDGFRKGGSFKDDDGSMYNPFAEAFKNMKKKG
jgi:uncharacterized protein